MISPLSVLPLSSPACGKGKRDRGHRRSTRASRASAKWVRAIAAWHVEVTLSTQPRLCWRSSTPCWSVRTMLKRVAFAAVASAFVMAIPTSAFAQVGPAELLVRIDRLENQIRQLTGEIEQMQYRNQQLEAALRRLQDDNGGSRAAAASPGAVAPNQPGMPGRRSDAFDPMENPNAPGTPRSLGSTPPQPAPLMSRRSDAFDPVESPNAPGAPRVLGSIPPQAAPTVSPQRGIGVEPAPYGAPAGA